MKTSHSSLVYYLFISIHLTILDAFHSNQFTQCISLFRYVYFTFTVFANSIEEMFKFFFFFSFLLCIFSPWDYFFFSSSSSFVILFLSPVYSISTQIPFTIAILLHEQFFSLRLHVFFLIHSVPSESAVTFYLSSSYACVFISPSLLEFNSQSCKVKAPLMESQVQYLFSLNMFIALFFPSSLSVALFRTARTFTLVPFTWFTRCELLADDRKVQLSLSLLLFSSSLCFVTCFFFLGVWEQMERSRFFSFWESVKSSWTPK